MGRTITLVHKGLFHWTVLIDQSALLQGADDQEKVFVYKIEAMIAGFDFVYNLSVDEGKVTST